MNLDAAMVLEYLNSNGRSHEDELEKLPLAGSVGGALTLLEAVGKVRLVDAEVWEAM